MEIDVYLFVGIFFVVQDVQSFNAWRWRKHERWSYLGDTSCKFLILADLTTLGTFCPLIWIAFQCLVKRTIEYEHRLTRKLWVMQFSSIHLMLFVIEWSTMCHKSIVGLNTENKYMIPHFDIIGTMFNRTKQEYWHHFAKVPF